MKEKIVVIKYGGAAMQSPELVSGVLQDVVQMKKWGICPVVVHGGGPAVSEMCQKVGLQTAFADGLRITDADTLEIAQMVLAGKINKKLVSQLNGKGGQAVGLSGQDGNLLAAKAIGAHLGFVGEVEAVNPEILHLLIQAGYIPVIAPITQEYNINADSAASAIAASLKADRLMILTDVAGVLRDPKDETSTIETIRSSEVDALIESGVLSGGMIPKIKGALTALQGGVGEVQILDGRAPHALLFSKGTTFHV